jgi:hypothetical protein
MHIPNGATHFAGDAFYRIPGLSGPGSYDFIRREGGWSTKTGTPRHAPLRPIAELETPAPVAPSAETLHDRYVMVELSGIDCGEYQATEVVAHARRIMAKRGGV